MLPCNIRWATHLSEVTRVILVHHDSVVMLPTSVTTAARVLPVLPHAPMAGADVPALLPVLPQPCESTKRK
jgi:hypothetical protein